MELTRAGNGFKLTITLKVAQVRQGIQAVLLFAGGDLHHTVRNNRRTATIELAATVDGNGYWKNAPRSILKLATKGLISSSSQNASFFTTAGGFEYFCEER